MKRREKENFLQILHVYARTHIALKIYQFAFLRSPYSCSSVLPLFLSHQTPILLCSRCWRSSRFKFLSAVQTRSLILRTSNLCALSRRPFSLGTLPSSRDGWFFAPRNPSSMILTNSFLTYFFLVYVVLHSPLLFHRRFVVERRTFDFALNRNAHSISRLLAPSSVASERATIQLFAVVKVVHLVIKPWFHTACILFSEMH